MFGNILKFFKKFGKNEKENSSSAAKERLHLVLAQDRANISADFLEMMKQEIIDVIKKYIDIDEEAIDVRMTNKTGDDGMVGAPALYANIPIVTIKNEARKLEGTIKKETSSQKEIEQKDKEVIAVGEEIESDMVENNESEDVLNQETSEENVNKEDTSDTENNKEDIKEEKDEEENS